MMINSYRDRNIRQVAMDLVQHSCRLIDRSPDRERFGLTNQIQRAVVSVPSSIAQAHARDSTKGYLRQIPIALGSLAKVATQRMLAARLLYITQEDLDRTADTTRSTGRMPRRLQPSLKHRLEKTSSRIPTPDP